MSNSEIIMNYWRLEPSQDDSFWFNSVAELLYKNSFNNIFIASDFDLLIAFEWINKQHWVVL